MSKTRIVILGAGFGGVYTARYLESRLSGNDNYEIILINRDNYFVYQPMLAEVVGGSLGIADSVSPLRRLLPKTKIYIREIDSIHIETQEIILVPEFSHTPLVIKYDHLVIALGNVTDFRGTPGLHEHALPFKNLADSIRIRNHLIEVVESASIENDPVQRKKLLTFVVGGGGFSGTEVVAEVNDFARNLCKHYPSIPQEEIRVCLIHSKDRLMERELPPSLDLYAEKILRKRGVEFIFNRKLHAASPQEAFLDNGDRISTYTVISTVPSSPNPLLEHLPLPLEKGKIQTDSTMQVIGKTNVWALGDCAIIPLADGKGFCPPTAQFAIREAKVLANNIINSIEGKKKTEFQYKAMGMLGALGHHNAVGEFFGRIKISGIFAWLIWRFIYWMKMPGIDRKIKVGLSWMLDLIIPPESVQLKVAISQGITQLHFGPHEVIFHEGDIGDYLYIIIQGQVEVCREREGNKITIAKLGKGEFFGEKSLLNLKRRSATVISLEPTDLLAIRKNDFGALIANFDELRTKIEKIDAERKIS